MSPLEGRDALYAAFLAAAIDPALRPRVSEVKGGYAQAKIPKVLAALDAWAATPRKGRWLEDELALGEILYNHGLYFETHEYLEAAWQGAPPEWEAGVQGLIQIAAGFHKLELDPEGRGGALYLLERGLQKVRGCAPLGAHADGLEAALRPAIVSLSKNETPSPPRLKWT